MTRLARVVYGTRTWSTFMPTRQSGSIPLCPCPPPRPTTWLVARPTMCGHVKRSSSPPAWDMTTVAVPEGEGLGSGMGLGGAAAMAPEGSPPSATSRVPLNLKAKPQRRRRRVRRSKGRGEGECEEAAANDGARRQLQVSMAGSCCVDAVPGRWWWGRAGGQGEGCAPTVCTRAKL